MLLHNHATRPTARTPASVGAGYAHPKACARVLTRVDGGVGAALSIRPGAQSTSVVA
jgi:hypothetical protein